MNKAAIRSLVVILVCVLIAFLIAKANEPYSISLNGYSLYLLLGMLAFVINWVAFIPAYKMQTEHFYDLTGSMTYLSIMIIALIFGDVWDNPRAILLITLSCIWSIRLGSFLFLRIKKDGKDSRFDDIKPVASRFLMTWTLQALWVFLTLAAALAVITSVNQVALGIYGVIGLIVWIFGITIEVIADQQKRAFKKDPKNKGRFISSGLWAYSRHPNYFGEITLWIGVFIICIPVLQGWQWTTIISPIFVYLLITKVSGVNKLEKIADKRWGGEPAYEAYKQRTSELLLMPPKK